MSQHAYWESHAQSPSLLTPQTNLCCARDHSLRPAAIHANSSHSQLSSGANKDFSLYPSSNNFLSSQSTQDHIQHCHQVRQQVPLSLPHEFSRAPPSQVEGFTMSCMNGYPQQIQQHGSSSPHYGLPISDPFISSNSFIGRGPAHSSNSMSFPSALTRPHIKPEIDTDPLHFLMEQPMSPSPSPSLQLDTPLHDSTGAEVQKPESEPYASLIFKALRDAPGYRMVLKDIYTWFEQNTNKTGGGKGKGWQNSIRHNLSMNGDFQKEEQQAFHEDSKKCFAWVLTNKAIRAGKVESTTRYRKNVKGHSGSLHQRLRGEGAGGAVGRRSNRRTSRHEYSTYPFNAYWQHQAATTRLDDSFLTHGITAQEITAHDQLRDDGAYYFNNPQTPAVGTPATTMHSSIPETITTPADSPQPSRYNFEDVVGLTEAQNHHLLFADQLPLDLDQDPLNLKSGGGLWETAFEMPMNSQAQYIS